MIDSRTAPYGALVLRLALGLGLIAHSLLLKIFIFTLPGTVQFFQSLGLPGPLAYLTLIVEAIAGVMLVLGYRTRIAALAALPFLVGATWAHAGNGWMFQATGGGWEFPAFWAAMLVVQALLGDGAHALGARQDQPVRQAAHA